MNPLQEIKNIIASGDKLSDAQVVRANHLALPVGVLLRFTEKQFLIGVNSDDDTIGVSLVSDDSTPENLERDAFLRRFVGCQLKSFALFPNKQGYIDAAYVEFLDDSDKILPIRLVAGASQLELIDCKAG